MFFGLLAYYVTWTMTSYGILASDDPQTLSNFGLLNELGVFWFSVFLAGHVSMFPRFLYVVLINSRLTPSRMVHMAFSHHKKALRGVIRADKATLGTLHQQSKTDKNFWTDTFDPDKELFRPTDEHVFAAVVPRSDWFRPLNVDVSEQVSEVARDTIIQDPRLLREDTVPDDYVIQKPTATAMISWGNKKQGDDVPAEEARR